MLHLGIGFLDQVFALEEHLAADDPGRRRQDPQNGQGQGALARAGLADNAQGFAGIDAQRHLIDRAHHPGSPGRET